MVPWVPTVAVWTHIFGAGGQWSSTLNHSLQGPLPCPHRLPPPLHLPQAGDGCQLWGAPDTGAVRPLLDTAQKTGRRWDPP